MNLKQSRRHGRFYSIPLYVQPLVTNNRIHILFWTLLWCRFLGKDDYIQSWYSLWRVSINFASSNMGHRLITRKFPETPKLKMIPHEIQLKMLWSIHLIACIPDIYLGWNWGSLWQIITVTFFAPKSFALSQFKCLLYAHICMTFIVLKGELDSCLCPILLSSVLLGS